MRTQREPEAIKKGLLSRSCCHGTRQFHDPRLGGKRENNSHLPSLFSYKCPPLLKLPRSQLAKEAKCRGQPPGIKNKQRKGENRSEKQRRTRTLESSKILLNNAIMVPLGYCYLSYCQDVLLKYQHTDEGVAETYFKALGIL